MCVWSAYAGKKQAAPILLDALKKTEGYRCILPMALTNGSEGYYPMRSAFDEGGYEARSSRYQGGVAEQIIADGQALLKELL